MPIAGNATILGASPLPIAVIHGADDEVFPIDPVRRGVAQLVQQGAKVRLAERSGGSHLSPCAYVSELAAAGQWLDQAGSR